MPHNDPDAPFLVINPDLPICWEDEDTVRIGFEYAEARVRSPSTAEQKLLELLGGGILSSALARTARVVGTSPSETSRLLRELEPTLQRVDRRDNLPEPAYPLLRAAVFDNGVSVAGLGGALSSEVLWTLNTTRTPEQCDLVFHIERYLEPLEFAQRWQSARVPHVLLRYTDRAVHVGPIVDCSPGSTSTGPCHSCLSLSHVSGDAQAPALAAQLYGRRPQSESADAAEMTVALLALLVRQWLRRDPAAHLTRFAIPMVHGRVSGLPSCETVAPHPGCGCQGLGAEE